MKTERKYKPYKRMSKEEMELRKIARVIGVELRTVQYH